MSLFSTDRGKHKSRCKSCCAFLSREYYRLNPEKAKEAAGRWKKLNPEKNKESAKNYKLRRAEKIASYLKKYRAKTSATRVAKAKQWKLANPEKERAIRARHQKKNMPKIIAYMKRREADTLKATPAWANKFFIDEAYFLADLRTKITGIKWHVDHIVPLRSKLVCGLHSHTNLQVITAYENQRKSNRYWPDQAAAQL